MPAIGPASRCMISLLNREPPGQYFTGTTSCYRQSTAPARDFLHRTSPPTATVCHGTYDGNAAEHDDAFVGTARLPDLFHHWFRIIVSTVYLRLVTTWWICLAGAVVTVLALIGGVY